MVYWLLVGGLDCCFLRVLDVFGVWFGVLAVVVYTLRFLVVCGLGARLVLVFECGCCLLTLDLLCCC